MKVYRVVVVLFIAGLQVPVIALFEFNGNVFNTTPSQMSATAVNVGTVEVFTVIVIDAVEAHCPASGVKV